MKPSPLSNDRVATLLKSIPTWSLDALGRLVRELTFPDFRSALAFANRVGEHAESRGHHPDITIGWGYATLVLWTHDAGGLTERDFALAVELESLTRPTP